MEATILELTWFIILGVATALYAILDGFDLGAGILYLFTTSDDERSQIRYAIGPVWDGNEVWLIAVGGGMFAAFPLAYATIFSSMYFAVMLLIWSLILRAVSFEFRTQYDFKVWKKIWDGIFIIASFLPALLLGVAVGNILTGLNLDVAHYYTGTFFDLLNPFAVIVGLLVVFVFITHGASYLVVRTEGALEEKMNRLLHYSWIIYLVLFFVVNIAMILTESQLLYNFNTTIIAWIIPILSLILILGIYYFNNKKQYLYSFFSSVGAILFLVLSIGIAIYPNIVPAVNENYSITLSMAGASETALGVMMIIAGIGLPLVLIYTFLIYRIFVFHKVFQISNY